MTLILPTNGACPKCGTAAEKFMKALGGREHCPKCGFERTQS